MNSTTTAPDSVLTALEQTIGAHADRTAIVDGPSGRAVDYRELGRRVSRIAGWLRADGIGPGHRVAVWAPNVPPAAATMLAALRTGATVALLSPAWTEPEAARMALAARVSAVVTIPPLAEAARRIGVRRVIVLGEADGAIPFGELLAHDGDAHVAAVSPDHVSFLCASSGTTGAPKWVALTHGQMHAVCTQIGEVFRIGPTDVTLAVAPWFHILGLTAELLAPLVHGAAVVALPGFDPAVAFGLIDEHAVTWLAVPPPVAGALVHHPAAAGRSFASLDLLAVGGASLPIGLQHELADRLPACAIGQGWGLTETSGALCIPDRIIGARPGTVGRPLPGTEIRVVDPESGRSLDAGTEGELTCRGPQVMNGYLDRPRDTAAAFTTEGWLRTGDLGRVDPDGS